LSVNFRFRFFFGRNGISFWLVFSFTTEIEKRFGGS